MGTSRAMLSRSMPGQKSSMAATVSEHAALTVAADISEVLCAACACARPDTVRRDTSSPTSTTQNTIRLARAHGGSNRANYAVVFNADTMKRRVAVVKRFEAGSPL